jgi:biopolymer transport protein ExbB/TolQ
MVEGVSGSFATTIEANTLVVADRTVSWDGTGYGSHAESATEAPRTTWYFAEGATMGGFNTFYLLLNPGASPAEATVTYLRAGRAPRSKTYAVAPGARLTVWVDMERWDDGDSLEAAEASARIDATAPIIAERAMYLDRNGQLFTAGHDSVAAAERAIERATMMTTADMKKGLGGLATIATTAPFIGLFGTVIGIINAFRGMAASGAGGLGSVSAGISEALVTTALGLFVAIPAVWLYNLFLNKIERFQVEMSNSASELIDYFMKRQAAKAA